MKASFSIPTSLQDLEREPHSLLPYPAGFEDNDEATRANSFDELVNSVQRGNEVLRTVGMRLFSIVGSKNSFDEWNDRVRIQALYTLVRKSCSLSPATKRGLIESLCEALNHLNMILNSFVEGQQPSGTSRHQNVCKNTFETSSVSDDFRSAYIYHLYMLYTVMFLMESEAKVGKSIGDISQKTSKTGRKSQRQNGKDHRNEDNDLVCRKLCAQTMMKCAQTMGTCTSKLWKCGVLDENVVCLPCRIAYQMIENASSAVAKRIGLGESSIRIIAATAKSADCLMNTIVTALMDLLHSFEHAATIVAELCCILHDSKIVVEILREIGQLGSDYGKGSGVKNVARFITEFASKKPQVVLDNSSLLLPHLDAEPYNLRSAIVIAIGHILTQKDLVGESTIGHEGKTNPTLTLQDMKKRTEGLFELLTERATDISSYTRVAVLKTLTNLIEMRCIPMQKMVSIADIALDRLQDKTVMVRRSAVQILRMLVESNPYTDSLCPKPYETKKLELRRYLLDHLPPELQLTKDAAIRELDETDDDYLIEKNDVEEASIKAAVVEIEKSENQSDNESEFTINIRSYLFVQSALVFINLFENSIDSFQSMLLSSNTSDVVETLRFFVCAHHFQLPFANMGIKQSLSLIWSDDITIQNEVLDAFFEVFFIVPGSGDKQELLPANKIVHKLLILVNKATVSELASIEEAICRLVGKEMIPADCFLIFWSIAAKAPGQARSAAMLILSMGASSDPSIVDSASRLRHLMAAGLGEYTERHRDWSTARSAACALQRVARMKQDINSAKYIVLQQILERLCCIVQGDWCNDTDLSDTQSWFAAAEQAINAIFVISSFPERICRDIIKNLQTTTFGCGGGGIPQSFCSPLRLSRFFFVVSHISLRLLVYTEEMHTALRRAHSNRTLTKQQNVGMVENNDTYSLSDEDEDDAIEAELGIALAAEADIESRVTEITEKEIIGRGLIGLYTPLLIRIIGNEEDHFSSDVLLETSVLSLCKFMTVSGSFCEKYLPLLFTALSTSSSTSMTMRTNTIVALGDLVIRFPNEVEPYTQQIYAFLREDSISVRRHTLMVLTHLILNDMIKVKGQVCEIALCLRDEDIRMRDMARFLFHELSKRSNNPVYNLLPDIISQLSSIRIAKEDFRCIMTFLLGFITKERQNEMLVDKLCLRFPQCTSISAKADISYCLAQLKSNEKCIRLLNDHFNLYKDALFDDDVLKNLMLVASRLKKMANKPELKQQVDEWEVRLAEQSKLSLDNEKTTNRVPHTVRNASLDRTK